MHKSQQAILHRLITTCEFREHVPGSAGVIIEVASQDAEENGDTGWTHRLVPVLQRENRAMASPAMVIGNPLGELRGAPSRDRLREQPIDHGGNQLALACAPRLHLGFGKEGSATRCTFGMS